MLLSSFPILSYPIQPHLTIYWMYQTICQANPIKFIIKLYINHIPYWLVKHPIKKLSLQALLLFRNKTTWSTTTLFSIQSVLNSLQNNTCSFIFTTLLVDTTTLTISIKIFLQLILTSLIHLQLFIKSFLEFPLALLSSIPLHFFTFLFLYLQPIFVTSIPY